MEMCIRVLFADPDERLLAAYRRFFVRMGFEVATVSSGADCFTRLSDGQLDVLVLEPDLTDGWADRIALFAEAKNVPLLILSRWERCPMSAAVCEYHVKPVSMATLARSVRAAAAEHTAVVRYNAH